MCIGKFCFRIAVTSTQTYWNGCFSCIGKTEQRTQKQQKAREDLPKWQTGKKA